MSLGSFFRWILPPPGAPPGSIARRFADAPLRRIADAAAHEVVKIRGRVVLTGPPARVPTTRAECAVWAVLGNRRLRGRRDHVVTLFEGQDGVELLVDDGSGRALLSPRDVRVVTDRTAAQLVGPQASASTPVKSLFETSGTRWDDDAVIDAWWIAPGETVVVLGRIGPAVAGRSTGDGEGYRDVDGPRSVQPAPEDERVLVAVGPPYDVT